MFLDFSFFFNWSFLHFPHNFIFFQQTDNAVTLTVKQDFGYN